MTKQSSAHADDLNRETPLDESQSWVTPNRLFFVRSHFETPQIDLSQWKLTIDGCVQRSIELNWEQFSSLPQRSVFATIECAGNGRSFLTPKVKGVQWRAGAVGHAEWSGVPLSNVLQRAGLKPATAEILCEGADSGDEEGSDHPIHFARSLPLDKAMHADTLLATHMNGEPLEPDHGWPVRLLVPGWFGVASVKWLNRIQAIESPFRGYFQTAKYTFDRRTGGGRMREIVGPLPVKSEIIRPANDDRLGIGTNRIFGVAWAGEDAVAAVEVSVDGGTTWRLAELLGPSAPYSWTLWEYLWEVAGAGHTEILARAVSDRGEVQPSVHDPLRGGYLINFSRPARVYVDPTRKCDDSLGDIDALHREMMTMAEERSTWPLDVEIESDLIQGAGI